MTTNINITVGGNSLVDQAKVQQQAARAAKLLQDNQARIEAEAKAKREAELARQGLAPDGKPLYGSPFKTQLPTDEPAAQRVGAVSVGAYQFKLSTTISIESLTKSDNATFEIATANGTSIISKNYGGSSVTVPSPEPDIIPSIPPSIFFSLGAPPDEEIYNGQIEGDLVNSAINRSEVYTIPAGKNSAYVVVYLNYGYAYARTRNVFQYVRNYTVWETQVVLSTVEVGGVTVSNVGWPGNPEFVSKQYFPDETIELWSAVTPTTETTSTYETVYTTSRFRNECYVYYVTENSVTEVTANITALHEKIKTLNPPVGPATEQLSRVASTLQTYSPTGAYSTSSGGGNVRYGPLFEQNPVVEENINIAAPTVGAATKKIPLNTDLAYYLGGLYMLNPAEQQFFFKAWGPSFAIMLLQNPPNDFNFEQDDPRSRDYNYMESTYLRNRPVFYISPCVQAGVCSSTEITWYKTRTRPATTSQYLPADNFRPFNKNTVEVVPVPDTTLVFFTDWGKPTFCVGLALQLGLTAPS